MADPRRAARWAYEAARARQASMDALAVGPAGVAAYLSGARVDVAIVTGVTLYLLTAVGGWWRSDLGRGALVGAATILIPTVLSVYMKTLGCGMTPTECAQFCLSGSALLGSIAGFMLGHTAGRRSAWFAGAAVTTTTFAVFIGCTSLGFGSLLGLGIPLALIGVPTFVWARAAA